ncbi:MAG: CHAT domain-containing protein [Nostoc sp.]|uniref:CHAT domain-containing protein n=1 Tax=Nostoc sp. TaxID=1180 RepID=UPI002FF8C8E8
MDFRFNYVSLMTSLKIMNTNMPQLLLKGLILSLFLFSYSETANGYPKPTLTNPTPQKITQNNTPDSNRAAAQKAEAEAEKLKVGTTPITQVIAKWEEALKYWRLAKDRKKEAKILNTIALFYWFRGEYPKALGYAQKALPICQALGDKDCEGTAINLLALTYEKLGEYQKAIDNYRQVPSLLPEPPDLLPSTLKNIGLIYGNQLGEKQKALDSYNQVLAFWKEKGDVLQQAGILEYIAGSYTQLGEINKSLEMLKQANTLDPEFKRDTSISNLAYFGLASSICTDKLASLKKPPKIEQPKNSSNQSATPNSDPANTNLIEDFKQKAQKWRTREILSAEADFLTPLGDEYYRIGEYTKAIEVYQQALKLRRIMGGKPKEADTLSYIADILKKQGKKQEAINFLNQALDIQRQIKTRPEEANTLTTLGDVYSSLGAYPESLHVYNQALSLWQIIGNRSSETSTLSNIGDIYRKLQDYPQALNYYQQALSTSQKTGNCNKEAILLSQISRNYLNSGDYQQAISVGNQALALSGNLEIDEYKLAIEAGILNIRAQVKIKQENYSQALEDSQKARKVAQKSGFRDIEGKVITVTSEAYASLKQPQKAIQSYQEQLALYSEMGLLPEQAQSLYNIAKLQRQNKQLPEALTEIDKAIEKIENIRKEVVSEDLRTSFFATVQDYYQLKIDILMEMHKKDPSKGNDAKALLTSEASRARGLVELLAEANANIREGIKPELLERERNIQHKLNALEQQQLKLVSLPNTEKQIADIKQQIEKVLNDYQELRTEIRINSPRYAALKFPESLTLKEIQQKILDENTLLLTYSLGEERSYLWLVSKTEIHNYELPKRAEIKEEAKQFHKSLTIKPGLFNSQKISNSATKLSQMLLQPVANKLGKKRLLIVSDGALQYVPFSALPVCKDATCKVSTPLLANHEIINSPSVSTIAILRSQQQQRKPAPKTLAVLADPVFSKYDTRLSPKGKQYTFPAKVQPNNQNNNIDSLLLQRSASELGVKFTSLPFTGEEAENIFLEPESSIKALRFDANRAFAMNPQLSQYRYIHFATHGILNSTNPKLSAVVLSLVNKKGEAENGYLTLNDIFNLKLPAELVVLSACETGLGKEVRGEGLVGLTRGFMYAGSPRLVVSLWKVQDQGTSVLMKKFYTKMLRQGLKPAEALRAAQLEMLQSEEYSAPYYWAAFTLQGEWR